MSPLSSFLKKDSGVHDYPEHVIQIGNLSLNETARMIRSRVPRADVRIEELLSVYSSELQTVSTPMKVLEVARKLGSMTLCKEAFDLDWEGRGVLCDDGWWDGGANLNFKKIIDRLAFRL